MSWDLRATIVPRSSAISCAISPLCSEDAPVEKVTRISGRVLVMYQASADASEIAEAADLIARVPGVARVSCGFVCDRELDQMYAAADAALSEAGAFDTSGRWSRVATAPISEIDSMEMNQLVGAYLCERYPDKKVKMKHPDVEVHVEVVQGHSAYIYAQSIPGVGGLPVGTAGKVVCLMSSGIDSPVAAWRMARRGATCIGVHFSGRPQTASTSEYLVDDIAHVLERFGGIARVYVVPFGDYQRDIAGMVPPALRIIIYRRLMMMLSAERIARREGAKALVTGENLGQVASQTLDNLAATNAAVEMQIFRPLIGSDKLENDRRRAKSWHVRDFEQSCSRLLHVVHAAQPRDPCEDRGRRGCGRGVAVAGVDRRDHGESRAARIPLPFVIPRSRCGPCRRAGAI